MKQRSLILGALAAAGAVVALSGGRGRSRRSKPSDCPDVDSGETYEYRGVRFKESMKGGADRRDAVPMAGALQISWGFKQIKLSLVPFGNQIPSQKQHGRTGGGDFHGNCQLVPRICFWHISVQTHGWKASIHWV